MCTTAVSYTHLDVYKRQGALYQAMEFRGSAIENLSMDERLSISNMAIEAGGKAGLIPVDDITREYLKERAERPFTEYHSDPDAVYEMCIRDRRNTMALSLLGSRKRSTRQSCSLR